MCRAVSRETENDAKTAKNPLNSGVFGGFFLRIKPEKQAKNKFDPFLREIFTDNFCVFLPNFSGCFVTQIFYDFLFVSQCFIEGPVFVGEKQVLLAIIKEKSLKKPHDGGVFWGNFRFV